MADLIDVTCLAAQHRRANPKSSRKFNPHDWVRAASTQALIHTVSEETGIAPADLAIVQNRHTFVHPALLNSFEDWLENGLPRGPIAAPRKPKTLIAKESATVPGLPPIYETEGKLFFAVRDLRALSGQESQNFIRWLDRQEDNPNLKGRLNQGAPFWLVTPEIAVRYLQGRTEPAAIAALTTMKEQGQALGIDPNSIIIPSTAPLPDHLTLPWWFLPGQRQVVTSLWEYEPLAALRYIEKATEWRHNPPVTDVVLKKSTKPRESLVDLLDWAIENWEIVELSGVAGFRRPESALELAKDFRVVLTDGRTWVEVLGERGPQRRTAFGVWNRRGVFRALAALRNEGYSLRA